eukprot:CAMPEP_0182490310 /NCGR_PEP_ID=MMETSP1321-20130603/219_1 /TAXON_ID=91990 /ORGANISM="Bolidomonas sp., Strain RCC1657" /LENGTH=107 /DNA_ID=CAMNT_0024692471 /DNA_START=723 /DNA_END=1046 /DNA_ORIENTATION=+
MLGNVSAKGVLVILVSDGIFSPLLKFCGFGLWNFSLLMSSLMYVFAFFVPGKFGGLLRSGAQQGTRLRCLKRRKVVMVNKGGHHFHLSEEGAKEIAELMTKWCDEIK